MKAIKGKFFSHGIHVKDMKYLAAESPIEKFPTPASVTIALSQSIGKPSLPVVQVGDHVAAGQMIAKADGVVSSNVFASIAGTVKSITGEIVIEGDGSSESVTLPPLSSPTPEQIKARVAEAGIVGMGGAAFPTAVKLAPRTPVDTLIVNGAECEPYFTCDDCVMREKTDALVQGIKFLATALGVSNVMIGIEANKPKAIAAFEGVEGIQTVILKKQYPMGSEKHLIYCCTGRKVGLGKLPADVGVIVQNVATCHAVYEAVALGKPLYERVVTVSGKGVTTPKNLLVPVGTSFERLLDYCGVTEETVKIVNGGPMTGTAVSNLHIYTKKATCGVLALTAEETDVQAPTPCINCGKCASVCPMHLMPMQTGFYAEAGDFEEADKRGGVMSCIECGACAYICPAKRPLLQDIKRAKAALRAKQK